MIGDVHSILTPIVKVLIMRESPYSQRKSCIQYGVHLTFRSRKKASHPFNAELSVAVYFGGVRKYENLSVRNLSPSKLRLSSATW